jgi:hypothetical protein
MFVKIKRNHAPNKPIFRRRKQSNAMRFPFRIAEFVCQELRKREIIIGPPTDYQKRKKLDVPLLTDNLP